MRPIVRKISASSPYDDAYLMHLDAMHSAAECALWLEWVFSRVTSSQLYRQRWIAGLFEETISCASVLV